eukprot:scaffold11412_cov72-Isochrysis_galbana.AAC.2
MVCAPAQHWTPPPQKQKSSRPRGRPTHVPGPATKETVRDPSSHHAQPSSPFHLSCPARDRIASPFPSPFPPLLDRGD